MKKRLISLLLAVSMMLSILPVGAFAADSGIATYGSRGIDITDLDIDANGKPVNSKNGSSKGTGWEYDEATDTLTILSSTSSSGRYVLADGQSYNKTYPVITCKVVNHGILCGAVYTNTITNCEDGSIVFGIYKNNPSKNPESVFSTSAKSFYSISSSDGSTFGLNSKLYKIKTAYSLSQQSIKVNAPAGKVVSNITGAGSTPTGLGTDTAGFTMGESNVTITFANKPGYTPDEEILNLAIENGAPVGSNNGQNEVLNGKGWTYEMTTLDNGSNEMTLCIDAGTDTSALNDAVINVPVKCASTLSGGVYLKNVELTDTGSVTGGIFSNDVKKAGISFGLHSVSIEDDSFFYLTGKAGFTKLYTVSGTKLDLTINSATELKDLTGCDFTQKLESNSSRTVSLTMPDTDVVLEYASHDLIFDANGWVKYSKSGTRDVSGDDWAYTAYDKTLTLNQSARYDLGSSYYADELYENGVVPILCNVVNNGVLYNGIYSGTVTNRGNIYSATFNDTVTNYEYIENSTFNGAVNNVDGQDDSSRGYTTIRTPKFTANSTVTNGYRCIITGRSSGYEDTTTVFPAGSKVTNSGTLYRVILEEGSTLDSSSGTVEKSRIDTSDLTGQSATFTSCIFTNAAVPTNASYTYSLVIFTGGEPNFTATYPPSVHTITMNASPKKGSVSASFDVSFETSENAFLVKNVSTAWVANGPTSPFHTDFVYFRPSGVTVNSNTISDYIKNVNSTTVPATGDTVTVPGVTNDRQIRYNLLSSSLCIYSDFEADDYIINEHVVPLSFENKSGSLYPVRTYSGNRTFTNGDGWNYTYSYNNSVLNIIDSSITLSKPANGGTYSGYKINTAGNIDGGTFNSVIDQAKGTISGGVFKSTVTVPGTIEGGLFLSNVYSSVSPKGGIFANQITGITLRKVSIEGDSKFTITVDGTDYSFDHVYIPDGYSFTLTAGIALDRINGDPIDAKNLSNDGKTVKVTANGENIVLSKALSTVSADDFTVSNSKNYTYGGDTVNKDDFTISKVKTAVGDATIKGYYKVDANGDATGDLLTTAPTDAGTYQVVLDVAKSNDYAAKEGLTNKDWQFTIAKKTITADDFNVELPKNAVYDGKPKTAAAVDKNNVTTGDITIQYEDAAGNVVEPINAGTYKVVLTVTPDANHTVTGDGTFDAGTFIINKAELTADMFEMVDTTGEKTVQLKAEYENSGVGKYEATPQKVTTSTQAMPVNAGTYQFHVNAQEGTNYNANPDLTDSSWQFTIDQYKPSADLFDVTGPTDLVYGDEMSDSKVTITPKASDSGLTIGTATVAGYYKVKDDGTADTSDLLTAEEVKDAGTYQIVLNVEASSDYEAATNLISNGQFTIDPKDVDATDFTVTVADQGLSTDKNNATAFIYDGKPKGADIVQSVADSVEVTYITLDAEGNAVGTPSRDAPINVGRYVVKVNPKTDKNHSYSATTVDLYWFFTIEKAELTKDDFEKFTETGKDEDLTIVPKTGRVGVTVESVEWRPVEETTTYSIPLNEMDSGTYQAYITVSAAENSNYKAPAQQPLTNSEWQFTIAKRTLTDEDFTVTILPNDLTYDGKAKKAEPTYTGPVTADLGEVSVKYEKKNAAGEWEDLDGLPTDAGDYRFTLVVAGSDNNNETTIESKDYTFTIKPHDYTTAEFTLVEAEDMHYDGQPKQVYVTADPSDIYADGTDFVWKLYRVNDDGTKTLLADGEMPTEEGTYIYAVWVKSTANHTGNVTEFPTDYSSYYEGTTPCYGDFSVLAPEYLVTVSGGAAWYLSDDNTMAAITSGKTKVPANSKVYLKANDATEDPDALLTALSTEDDTAQAVQWYVAADSETSVTFIGSDLTGYDVYFIMPRGNVSVTTTNPTPDVPGGGDDGSAAGTGAALVIGGAALGGAAYLVGTQVYLESALGSVPTNRQQMALALWNKAGKPEPVSTELFTDISAAAADNQKSARWCVEQGLMQAEGTTFQPDKYVFRPQVIKAYLDLQAKQKAN